MLNKRVILLTELYNNKLYDDIKYDEINFHYMLIGIYEPYTYYASHEINFDEIYEIINDDHNKKHKNINTTINLYRTYYKNVMLHPSLNNYISNYNNIVKRSDYIKPEIGYVTKLANGCYVVIKTTCWLKILQRKIRNIIKAKKSA